MTSAAGVADCALPRRKQGFESPREQPKNIFATDIAVLFIHKVPRLKADSKADSNLRSRNIRSSYARYS
jgi:hypothetical protein